MDNLRVCVGGGGVGAGQGEYPRRLLGTGSITWTSNDETITYRNVKEKNILEKRTELGVKGAFGIHMKV